METVVSSVLIRLPPLTSKASLRYLWSGTTAFKTALLESSPVKPGADNYDDLLHDLIVTFILFRRVIFGTTKLHLKLDKNQLGAKPFLFAF